MNKQPLKRPCKICGKEHYDNQSCIKPKLDNSHNLYGIVEKESYIGDNDEKWMQKAVKKPGSFTEYCGGEVTQECIERGKKSKDPLTRKRAHLAETFRKQAKKRKKE